MGQNPTYSDAVRERVFWVWLTDANQNARRTADLLQENPAYLAESTGEIAQHIPAYQTISHWVRNDGWVTRAQEELAASAPSKYATILGQKLVQSEQHQGWLADVMSCDADWNPHPRFKNVSPDVLVKLQLEVVKHTENVLGHGVIGQRFGKPELVAPEAAIDITGKTPLELAEENARKAQEGKGNCGLPSHRALNITRGTARSRSPAPSATSGTRPTPLRVCGHGRSAPPGDAGTRSIRRDQRPS